MHASPLILRTERLVLTLPPPEHAALLCAYYSSNRSHLERWNPPTPADFYTVPFWQKRLADNLEAFARGARARLYLRLAEAPDGPVLGNCTLDNVVYGPLMSCTLGYALDREYEGRGLMSEAVTETVRYAFDVLGLHRVTAGYVPTNERSAKVLKGLGFAIEGFARDYLFVGGQWRDHVLTGKVNPRAVSPSVG